MSNQIVMKLEACIQMSGLRTRKFYDSKIKNKSEILRKNNYSSRNSNFKRTQ